MLVEPDELTATHPPDEETAAAVVQSQVHGLGMVDAPRWVRIVGAEEQ